MTIFFYFYSYGAMKLEFVSQVTTLMSISDKKNEDCKPFFAINFSKTLFLVFNLIKPPNNGVNHRHI